MLRFFLNNYRAILHIIVILEFIFIAWILGLKEFYDLNPDHTIPKLIILPVIFLVAEWTIKKCDIEKTINEEKKKLDDSKK